MPSNVQVYIVGRSKGYNNSRVTIDVHNSKRLEQMTVKAMKTACAVCRSGRSIFLLNFRSKLQIEIGRCPAVA